MRAQFQPANLGLCTTALADNGWHDHKKAKHNAKNENHQHHDDERNTEPRSIPRSP